MASANDKFKKGGELFSTTLASGASQGASSYSLSSATGLPTNTGVVLTIDAKDANGNDTPLKRQVVKGTISGTTLQNASTVEGTDQVHSAGAVVTSYFTDTHWSDLIDGILVGHGQDGTHKHTVQYDANGNEVQEWGATASAVSHFKTTNAATGNNPSIQPTGEANRGLDELDSNGNEMTKKAPVASAVNELTQKNAATGNNPGFSATGGDTNIGIDLTPKGTGQTVATNLKSKGRFVERVSKTFSDTPYSILSTDDLVSVSAASGNTVATLPTAVGIAGRVIKVVRTDSTVANTLQIATTSSQTINGGASAYLPNQYDYLEVISDGSNWLISANGIKPLLASVVKTTSFTTASTSDVQITGLTISPIIPYANANVKVTVSVPQITLGINLRADTTIWDGTVGSGTQIGFTEDLNVGDTGIVGQTVIALVTVASPGVKTYNAGAARPNGGSTSWIGGTGKPLIISAELV